MSEKWWTRSGVIIKFTFMHLADAFIQSDSGYTCIVSMCVPWESNPWPFALLTQCSTTEPQELVAAPLLSHTLIVINACVSVSREDVEDAGPVAHFPQFSYSASIRESDWLRPIMHHDGLWSWSHVVCFSVQMDLSLNQSMNVLISGAQNVKPNTLLSLRSHNHTSGCWF